MKRLLSVLLWSAIAAAFIGPGTVTAAASAGAAHRYALLWALVFSTLTTFVLQEASGRLALHSGEDLAAALGRWAGGRWMAVLVAGAVILGCAAYQAGNLLGAVAGADLAFVRGDASGGTVPWLVALAVAAACLLFLGSPRAVARALSALVALMGVAFAIAAWRLAPPWGEVARGALVPDLPAGAGLLVLGLVGTTVVPYNLFLGSSLARGQSLAEMRFGLAVAIGLGGLISLAVMVTGAAVTGEFSFAAIGAVLGERLGAGARRLFYLGLLGAGLSSAVTAPLAAAITARGLARRKDGDLWNPRRLRFRAVWAGVLAAGLMVGLTGLQPVPVILLAQALNGVLLPIVTVFLLLAVNDRAALGSEGINGPWGNAALAVVSAVTVLLGVRLVALAVAKALGLPQPPGLAMVVLAGVLGLLLAVPLARRIRSLRENR
ncbi:MAG: divalent metal cation transporter [Acidobacteriota bacterium]